MVNAIRNLLVAGLGLVVATGIAQAQADIEQPKYDIIKECDGVELRQYAPHLVAEVTVEAGSMRQASSRGFRTLASYIFGNNQGASEIAMTAPVTTQPKSTGTTIAMTAPVTASTNEEGTYIIRFSMPSMWTMETLPMPNDDKVKLTQIGVEKRVVYKLVGDRSEARIFEATAKIHSFLTAENLEEASSVIIAGYDGPSVPAKRKRWEVMRVVK